MIKIGQTFLFGDKEYKRVSLATLKKIIQTKGDTTFYIIPSKATFYFSGVLYGKRNASNLENLEEVIEDYHFFNCNKIKGGTLHYYIGL